MADETMNVGEGQPALSRDQLMELVADGQRALGQGRADEALMVADSVLESDDQLPAAWALKGDALERQNRLQEALSCYEKVIDLKPDSALDRIRANHLRKLASIDELEVASAPPNRKQAALAAVAATVFFVLVGSAVVLASQPQSAAVNTAEQTGTEMQGTGDGQTYFVPPVPNTPGGGSQLPAGNTGEPTSTGDDVRPGYVQRFDASGRPMSGGSAGPVNRPNEGEGEVPPVIIGSGSIAPINSGIPTPPPAGNNGGNPVSDNPPPTFESEGNEPPKRDGGIIDIRPSTTGGGGGGNVTAPPTSDNDAQQSAAVLVRVARDHFVRGDYAKAADSYEKAIRAGAQRSSCNHRLGDCYKNLGRKAEAIAAYEKAIAAYQAEIEGGAEPTLKKNAIEACQQALKVLRGG